MVRLIPLLLLLLVLPAHAGRIELYRAEVAVPDQSDGSRRAALAEAVLQVLVRLTGDPSVTADPGVAAAARNAEQMLVGFQFRSVQVPSGESVAGGRELRLVADFDPGAVQRLLRENGLPFWGGERASVLVWLFDADPIEATPVTDSDDWRWFWLSQQAERRGVPLVLPLFDLQDRQRIQPQRLWVSGEQILTESRQRYSTALVLLAQPTPEGLRWRLSGDDLDAGSIQRGPLEVALPALINDIADLLGQRYAILPGEQVQGSQRLIVEGIGNALDFARLMSYLEGLSAISALHPEQASGQRLVLRVELAAAPQRLRQQIGIGTVLRILDPEGVDGESMRLLLLP